jgi:hypothetical protein
MRSIPLLLAINQNKEDLLDIARYSVVESMNNAWYNCGRNHVNPQEPDFVAALVLNMTKYIGNE